MNIHEPCYLVFVEDKIVRSIISVWKTQGVQTISSNRLYLQMHYGCKCLHLVTTPSSRMMLGWSNWPIMLASLRKSRLCCSEYPAFRLLMATWISLLLGSLRRPLQTSPNSPGSQTRACQLIEFTFNPLFHCITIPWWAVQVVYTSRACFWVNLFWLTSPNNSLNPYIGNFDLFGEVSHRLAGVLICVRVNVRAGFGKFDCNARTR